MSGDIVDELRFRVTVTRLGGQHTAREVMSDIMAMENARAEIVRLRAENDDLQVLLRGRTAELQDEIKRLRAEVDSLTAEIDHLWIPSAEKWMEEARRD